MENLITIKNQYNSLDELQYALINNSNYSCTKEYDIWEHRVDNNGQMAQCLVLKKSNMHAVKLFFINENTLKANHIIPNKIMQAYFGKSQKAYQNVLEIITGKIKTAVLEPAQNKAFNEIEAEIIKVVS
ncbi:hypothetical protein H9X57_04495 [Flavobacterium piscinae]|uniref:Uncharacterized protein n=1 Tax=Flavobacterium piscinae TaxID=2506424 RepID=A0A4Q1KKD1_9FLAO|nr:hypothetical protein [Flavobacterium piscinae]MBC8882903.1 hypothetical protein [Flavobacterium piscinae]RXR30102.1 hypothetical protein EQG68_11770 [Flavobacterium piscinae]